MTKKRNIIKPLAIITGYGHGFGRALNERFEKVVIKA